MAEFLLAAGQPDRLADLPAADRARYLTADKATLDRGKVVFAEHCARCHSSKLPEPLDGMQGPGAENCNGPGYRTCWDKYWDWTKTDDFKQKMRAIVQADDFLKDNFLASEFRPSIAGVEGLVAGRLPPWRFVQVMPQLADFPIGNLAHAVHQAQRPVLGQGVPRAEREILAENGLLRRHAVLDRDDDLADTFRL